MMAKHRCLAVIPAFWHKAGTLFTRLAEAMETDPTLVHDARLTRIESELAKLKAQAHSD